MKFASSISLLALALGVVAEPTLNAPTLVERDLATITGVLNTINSQVADLDTTVKGFSGDATTLSSKSDTVLQTIKDGTTKVSGTSEVTVTDALGIQSAVGTLTTTVQGVVNDLISQKSAIVGAGAGGTVLSALTSQKAASSALAQAITSKVPTALSELAATLSAGITDALQKGIDAYQGAGGSSGSGSSGSSGSSVASSAAAAPSSAATSAKAAVSSASGVVSSAVSSASAAVSSAAKVSTAAASSMAGMTHAAASASASASGARPAQFTGAANVNALSGSVGALAAVAAVLAF